MTAPFGTTAWMRKTSSFTLAAHACLGKASAIVFDLDGTLVDTLPDLVMALNDALLDCGYAPVPDALVRDSLHGGLAETAAAALAMQAVAGPGTKALLENYRAHYRRQAHARSVMYPAVREVLQSCWRSGQPMAVCTNKTADEAVLLLRLFQLKGFFPCVVAGDTAEHPKPHPAPLLLALQQLGAKPSEAVMVGDSHVDAMCAASVGVPFVLHTSGYGGNEVLNHPVAARFARYSELLS